jgi:hypothetical protein
MVGTLWEGLDIEHLPLASPEKKDVWNPIDYHPESVFKCTALIGEFQRDAQIFLDNAVARKVTNGKGTPDEIRTKLAKKLQHEQRALIGYDLIASDFLSVLGSDGDLDDLKARGWELLESIHSRLDAAGARSVTELQTWFVEEEGAHLPFKEMLFIVEREGWWTPEKRHAAKALDQLRQAEIIARALIDHPERLLELIEALRSFEPTYSKLESLPQAIIPQDAHPFNFFNNLTDGKTSMLDLEDLSMGVRFADLSTVYLFKILRGFVNQKITESQAIDLIRATLDGYNSEATQPLSKDELSLMADYNIGAFLNLLPQFGIILRLSPDELNSYNSAMSLDAFLDHFHLLQQISNCWADKFLPLFLPVE